MSRERLNPNPDELPSMTLKLGEDREFKANPTNTTLFTFLGRLAMYDHIFMQTGGETEDTMIGTYVFNTHDAYQPIAEFLMENHFPMVLNRLEVAECDVEAYDRMIQQQLGDLDSMPDWMNGNETGN